MNTYDEQALTELVKVLSTKPKSIRKLSLQFQRSERTIKRWIVELRARGHRIVKDGVATHDPYLILQPEYRTHDTAHR